MKAGTEERIDAFYKLGQHIRAVLLDETESLDFAFQASAIKLKSLITESYYHNAWFVEKSVRQALDALVFMLSDKRKIAAWRGNYPAVTANPKEVGVIMAGNLPAVGFHDFMCVLMSGHRFRGKLSSSDGELIPALADMLCAVLPDLKEEISFTDGALKNADAYISTGSNNSARYFEYYFGKYPHIIRKNRNALAVLKGDESPEQLHALGSDIFSFFGLGCRSVSKIYIPDQQFLMGLFPYFEHFADIIHHHKYKNNYDYRKSIFLVNKETHFDNGFLLVQENAAISSPVSVLHYEVYQDLDQLKKQLALQADQIQCIVANHGILPGTVCFGDAQNPDIEDYADGVDTMEFLMGL